MYRILGFAIFLLLAIACEKEKGLLASNGVENYFEVPDDATDEESVLRRNFQKETGSYLLFNDTLRKKMLGHDVDGFPIYAFETVELGYGVVTASSDKFTFRYLSDLEDKKNVTGFVKENILPLLEERAYPYSFLLVDTVFRTRFLVEEGDDIGSGLWGSRTAIDFYSGVRCLALSLGGVLEMDDVGKREFMRELFKGMIESSLTVMTTELAAFYAFGEEYYEEGDLEVGWDIDYVEDLRELGFLEGYISYGYAYFPLKHEELAAFINALFEDEETFLGENEEYPFVIQKYNLLKEIVKDLGYRLELLNQ